MVKDFKSTFGVSPRLTPEPGARQEFQTAVCPGSLMLLSLSVLCTFASGLLSDCQSRRRGGVSERETATVIIVEAKYRFAGDEPSNLNLRKATSATSSWIRTLFSRSI